MPKKKCNHPKPRWLQWVPPKWINTDTKRLYAYLCVFGPNSCNHWNCRLSKKFFVSKRTIARRLRNLRELGLIWIENRQSPHRIIHPVYYADMEAWLKNYQRVHLEGLIRNFANHRPHPHGQNCPSESVRESTTLSLPSKGRANTTGTPFSPGGAAPPKPPSGSENRGKFRYDRTYSAWVKHFLKMYYNEKSAHALAQRQMEHNLAPPQ